MTSCRYCRWAFTPLVVAGLLVLAGCHTDRSTASGDGNAVFPDPARAVVKEGVFVNVENLRNVAPGLTKNQLYALLGPPHFNEGVFGVRKWDYLFDFRKPDGSAGHVTCQFQVIFNSDALAKELHWKPEVCKSVLDRHEAVAAEPTHEEMPKEPIRLSSDALFNFDSATLTAAGRQQLDGVLQAVRSASQVESIRVVGYTDSIGKDRYNMNLSRRRASAVRDYLIAGGVPASAVQAEGRGASDPVASCAQTNREALIDCMASDRRVELSGIAQP